MFPSIFKTWVIRIRAPRERNQEVRGEGVGGLRKHLVFLVFIIPCSCEQIVIPRQLIQLPFCTAADLWMSPSLSSPHLCPPRRYYCPRGGGVKVTREFNSSPPPLANCRTLILLGKVILFAARRKGKKVPRSLGRGNTESVDPTLITGSLG